MAEERPLYAARPQGPPLLTPAEARERWGGDGREESARDDLIESLAANYYTALDTAGFGVTYADPPDNHKQFCRDQVLRSWPLIVEFVAEWIVENAEEWSRHEAADRWREEMLS